MIGAVHLDDLDDAALLSAALQKLLPEFADQPRKQAAIRRLLQRSKAVLASPATLH